MATTSPSPIPKVTYHAQLRFRERVCPDRSIEWAGSRLRELVAQAGAPIAGAPWPDIGRHAEGYLLILPGVVLPLMRQANGRFRAVSCVVRSGWRVRL